MNMKNCFGDTALILASKDGHKGVVELLLKQKDIQVNVKNKYGKTALWWASRGLHSVIVSMLLKDERVK